MTHAIWRILDVNLNRAREGLRVVEDYARFGLDDRALCHALKQLRHDLAVATAGVAGQSIAHRDTPADVGTTVSTPTEHHRDDARHVVTAACKRLGESLRTIEEYLKTVDGASAAVVEQIRYRFYTAEQRIAQRLSPLASRFASDVRLYVLITEAQCAGRPWLTVAGQAIAGGADCLQLREKDLESGELLRRARQLAELCYRSNVLFIVNDRADIAALSGADGVHLGQGDLRVGEARKIVGEKLVGVSTHEMAHARRAMEDGADYIGVGPIFKSATKPREFASGPEYARSVVAEVPIPATAIAGITLENVDEVLATGVRSVAITAAIVGAPDVAAAARAFKARLITSSLPLSPVPRGEGRVGG